MSVQAWPQESQPRKSWSSEPQAQSEEAGHIKSHHHTELQVGLLVTEQVLQEHCHAGIIPAP